MALPDTAPEDMAALLTTDLASDVAKAPPPPALPPAPPVDEIETSIAAAEERQVARGEPVDTTAVATRIAEIIAELAREEGIVFQSASAQYQTFLTRCRRERLIGPMPDMRAFRRRFAVAGAELAELDKALRARIMQLASAVEEDLLGPFLVIARPRMRRDAG